MIVYASVAQVSIIKLFVAGIVPGLILGGACAVIVLITALTKGLPKGEIKAVDKSDKQLVFETALVFSIPLFIVFGTLSGVFTATEAGGIACVYAVVLGRFVLKTLSGRDILSCMRGSMRTTASLYLVIAGASVLSYILTVTGAISSVRTLTAIFAGDPTIFLFFVLGILIVAGFFLEPGVQVLLLAPIFLPISRSLGIDEMQFAMVFLLSGTLSLMTPPVGICLFVAAQIGEISIGRMFKAIMPFLFAQIVAISLLIIWPDLVVPAQHGQLAMTKQKILVLTEQFTNECPLFDPLRDAGYEVVVNETGRLPDEPTLKEMLSSGVVATIAGGEPYTPDVIASAKDLKMIARWGVGYDKVNVPAATEHGIPLAMAFGQNHESVAEYAHAMALSLACGIVRRDAMVHGGTWMFDGFHPGLWERTAGLIGLGRIGGAMARRLKGQSMRVLVFDPYVTEEQAEAAGVEKCDLDTLLAESDLISVHAPSTPETRHTLNAETFAKMKDGVIVINTSRGPLIDEAALADALKSGKVYGAGLDVFETEPLQADSPLRSCDNVILSPHVSGMDKMAEKRVTLRCVYNILAWLNGNPEELLPYVVNPETLTV